MDVSGLLKERRSNILRPMWSKALKYINSVNQPIIEVGCCDGEFANMALENGYNYRWGIDSRSDMIERAQRSGSRRFLCIDNANTLEFLKCYDFDVLVFFNIEAMAKGVEDLELFAKIKQINPGARLILSFLTVDGIGSFVDIAVRYRCLMRLSANHHSSLKLSDDINCLIGEWRFANYSEGNR